MPNQIDLNSARVMFAKQQREQADLLDQLCNLLLEQDAKIKSLEATTVKEEPKN